MTIKQQLVTQLTEAIKELGITDVTPEVDYPTDAKHGDYATNVAMTLAKRLKKSPMAIAQQIAGQIALGEKNYDLFEQTHIAAPGFINFTLSKQKLLETLDLPPIYIDNELTDKKIVVEYAHPNPLKAFHIGHLRNIITGEAIVRLYETSGAKVIRANYQGDVGMHIAKALYGLYQIADLPEQMVKLTEVSARVQFLGKAYAAGSKSYEEEPQAKKEIHALNKEVYAMDPSIIPLYETARQWSLDYFEEVYKRVYSHFDRYYFESEVFKPGKENVLKGLKEGIFVKSEGAIIFPGEKYGLHSRVFITSEGNPTYEGKEMGLGPLQLKENNPDKIVHVVGPEQSGYFEVIFEALAQMFPETRGKEQHLKYGWVKLKHGKMSSRTGDVILGEWLLDEAKKKILDSYDITPEVAEQVAVGAVKYSFLKVGLAQEIAFDINESISLEGNSGPYLQYTYARTRSILRKNEDFEAREEGLDIKPEAEEWALLRMLSKFPEILSSSAERAAPNMLCEYLFEVAKQYNLVYQKYPILKAEDSMLKFRIYLTNAVGKILEAGLDLLGIEAPERM